MATVFLSPGNLRYNIKTFSALPGWELPGNRILTPKAADVIKASLTEKFGQIHDHWRPRVVAELNGQELKW